MCGIAGYVGRPRGADESHAELAAMCGVIRHRGPDDEGHFVAPGVALGMRRLSIIDVACGRQPIANEDGSVHVVFNGEIYNHRALQPALERAGHRFRTHSDTETLVHLYEEYGDAMVHHLRGMFGFALWDARRERLLVARDRPGIKPLYYWEAPGGGLAFASEARSLRQLPEFPAEVDPAAIAGYLAFGYVPEPAAVYRGVRKLPPGHLLVWERGRPVRVEQYWNPVRPEVRVEEQEAVEELRRLLTDAVDCHLESEVPLGAFLSGGIDSTTVVAHMARLSDRPVRTFAIGFDEPAYNEAPDAARAAAALGTEHTELIVRPDVDALVELVILGFDEPFADSSAIPTYLVSRLAREHVTVALSGDGGDELFGGYRRYAEVLGRTELPSVVRRALTPLARRLPHGTYYRNRLLDLGRTRRGRYAATVLSALREDEGGMARATLPHGERPLEAPLDAFFRTSQGRGLLTELTLVDVQSYLPGDILTKVDRMSMAVSLEARVPLLDHHVMEFALALPDALKLRDGTGKWLLRRAIEPVVPPFVLTKPKHGFGVPLARWFRHELRYRIEGLLRPDSPIYAYVDPAPVGRYVREHLSGRRAHDAMLWRLIVLDVWLRDAHQAPRAAAAA